MAYFRRTRCQEHNDARNLHEAYLQIRNKILRLPRFLEPLPVLVLALVPTGTSKIEAYNIPSSRTAPGIALFTPEACGEPIDRMQLLSTGAPPRIDTEDGSESSEGSSELHD